MERREIHYGWRLSVSKQGQIALETRKYFLPPSQLRHDLLAHAFVNIFLSVSVYLLSGSFFFSFLVITGGFIIDLDHLLDYFLYYKKRSLDLEKFLKASFLESGKVYLFLHSWELCLGLVLGGIFFQNWALLMFTLSMGMHLFIDAIQRKNPWFYFLTYRIFHRFDLFCLAPESIPDGLRLKRQN